MQEQRKNGLGAMGGSIRQTLKNRKRLVRLVPCRPGGSPTSKAENSPFKKEPSPSKGSFLISLAHHNAPVYLEFHRNEDLAASLWSERDARLQSFATLSQKVHVEMICRSRMPSPDHFLEHRDLHNLAKGFDSNTNSLSLRHFNSNDADNSNDAGIHSMLQLIFRRMFCLLVWMGPDLSMYPLRMSFRPCILKTMSTSSHG